MTADDDAEALRRSMFARTVDELSARYHLRCTVRLSRRASDLAYAEAHPLARRIVVSRATLAETDEEQAWSAAHEVGHLVDARERGLLRYLPWGFFGWLLTGAVVALFGPWLLITALRPVLPDPVPARLGIGIAFLAAGVAVFWNCLHRGLLSLGSRQRPQEDAADAFAKSQGYPVTIAIASMLHRHERRPDGQPASRRWRQYRRHRYPYDRINTDDI